MHAATAPRFRVLQSLWGMERLRPAPADERLSACFERIQAAGFDGISAHVYPGAGMERWIDEAQARGFVVEGNAFPRNVADLGPALELAARHRIHHLVIQGDVRPDSLEQAVALLQGWYRLAHEHGVTLHVETHRNTLTNDLWFTRDLLDRVPELTLLADLSHCVTGQEMNLPISARNQALIERVLARSQAYHGRVSSAEQIQLEPGWPLHRPWVQQFQAWWAWGFQHWLSHARPGDSLTYTCELGPAPYAISDADGLDRSDRWADAQQLRALALATWAQLQAAPPTPGGAP